MEKLLKTSIINNNKKTYFVSISNTDPGVMQITENCLFYPVISSSFPKYYFSVNITS